MTEHAIADAREPDGAPRIASLDIMRGIAILGILFMNIDGMGGSMNAGHGWALLLGWTVPDHIAWLLRQIVADGTARCMLEMLFGAGMVILTDRTVATAGRWAGVRRYYVRNLILFAFGMVHIFILLWPGDILHIYGLTALIVFPLRRLRPRWQLLLGVTFMVFTLVTGAGEVRSVAQENALVASAAQHRAAGQPVTADEAKAVKSNDKWHAKVAEQKHMIAVENDARSGSFASWRAALIGIYTMLLGRGAPMMWLWEAGATMLIGTALFRMGILAGQRSARFYGGMLIAGYGLAIPLRAIGAWQTSQFGDGISIEWSTSELARVAMTLGHVALIHLLLGTARGRALLSPFTAAGRTALSLYICQSLIGLWLLYPPFALGLYGKMGWAGFMLTALAIDALLLLVANWWVVRFEVAPVEWAWRSLAGGRMLRFRRKSRAAVEAAPVTV
ncbi:DUF418 domain-containing protein [Sphingomonas sp. AR_OL41]|uniref:DUF418 domain-containing protein n=1 Tax=Sphingomonas sp. AR_OL41 TaxID=3042729 RepID=UPI002480576E|nr:DUF418 domain-containing protein [Sphingomonas sp. AR_OL41]MDH7972638.1 DUF418 domain-containing protein [Sphingomonas sp. AR_OL41]